MLDKLEKSLWLITFVLGVAFMLTLYFKKIVIAAICLVAFSICYVFSVDK